MPHYTVQVFEVPPEPTATHDRFVVVVEDRMTLDGGELARRGFRIERRPGNGYVVSKTAQAVSEALEQAQRAS